MRLEFIVPVETNEIVVRVVKGESGLGRYLETATSYSNWFDYPFELKSYKSHC